MKRLLLCALTVALLGSSSGCAKSDAPTSPLTTSFSLLNEQGREATVFAQGQNIIFRFQITNPTDKNIILRNPPIDDTHFLEVTRIAAGKGAENVGKPYARIFCTFNLIYGIPAHQTGTWSIPWVEASAFPTSPIFCAHTSTSHLPTGRYRTSFTTPLTIVHADQPDEVTKPRTFTIEFEVK